MYFNLDYIYSLNWHNCHFFRIPKLLFEDARFMCVSFDARTFFAFLVDRVSLSAKNGWADKEGRIYIFYTLKEAMEKTGFGHNKMTHIYAELQAVGLIERVRQGQGKPIKIYVKDFCALLKDGFVPIPHTSTARSKELDGQMEMPWNTSVSREMLGENVETADVTAQTQDKEEAAESAAPVLYLPACTEPPTPQDAGTCAADTARDLSKSLPVADMAREMPSVTPDYPPVLPVCQPAEAVDTALETLIPSVSGPVENVENRGKFSTFVENPDTPAASPVSFYPPEAPQTSAERKSRLPLSGSPDFPKQAANKTKENNTEFSETDPSNPPTPTERSRRTRRSDWWKARMDEIDRCKREVRFQIGYDRLSETHPYDMEQVDDYVELIVDVLTSRKDYLYVSRENRPIEQVRGQFEKLDYEHMDYILDSMRNCATDVTNIRAYMLSTLFNAPNTIRTYYEAKVRHDMAQDDWWDSWPR